MRFVLRTFLLFTIGFIGFGLMDRENVDAWGFYGHKRINRMACYTLPPQMFGFYKRHIAFISDHAVDPDKRRYSTKGEAPRHYIDIDHYADEGEDPFEIVPRDWDDAVKKFTEDTLQSYGIVPWWIPRMYSKLVWAFNRGDVDRILRYSAEIGHYVGDAHVPLHTTKNYNGQLTNQVGIHAFWESRIPEIRAEGYDHLVGKAEYISSPEDAAWDIVMASHHAVDSVLKFEAQLTADFPSDQRMVYDDRGAGQQLTYSRAYSEAYETVLDGQVERRMNDAIHMLGSFWYSAWIDAGQPDLEILETKEVSDSLKRVFQAEDEARRMATKALGRVHPE